MSEKTLMQDLMALRPEPQDKERSKIARVRALMPGIETALEHGASHDDILKKLNEHGLEISKATFQTCLWRIRKKGKKDLPRNAAQPTLSREVITPSRSENETRGITSTRAVLGESKKKTANINYGKLMRDHTKANKEKP